METITFPRYLYFGEAIAAGEADSFPCKPKQGSHRAGRPDAVAAWRKCAGFLQHPAGVTYLLFARTKAKTAAKATTREQFVYGYMRSLRK
jgi:hypothetical protein